MRLQILRTSILALVLAATPASLSGGIPSFSNEYIVLAMSDVIACDTPHSTPSEARDAFLRVSLEGDAAPFWRTDIYDLADCLRMKSEAI